MFKKILMILCFSFLVSGAAKKEKTHKITLKPGNFSVLTGQVTNRSVAPIIQDLLTSDAKKWTIYIDSPGGSVFAGNDLIRAMKASGKEITCVADVAISMAFATFQQCDKRYVTESSVLMQHLISYGSQGTYRHNSSQAKFAEQLAHQMQKADSSAMGVSMKKFIDRTRDDWWFYGQNAIDEGAAEGMVQVTCAKELVTKRVKKTASMGPFRISYEASACPLIRGPLKKKVDKKKDAKPTKKEEKDLKFFLASLTSTEFIANIKMGLMRPKLWL